MVYSIIASISLGVVLGASGGYFGVRSIVRWLQARAAYPKLVMIGAGIGVLVLLPVAFFVAFNAGAGLESHGVPLGLAFGIGSVLAAGMIVGAAIGASVGYGVAAAMRRMFVV